MKLCLDPGHGMSNLAPGVYDAGAVHGTLEESDIAMDWADDLEAAFHARGIPTYRTRNNRNEATPVGQRAEMAETTHCTHLLSIHVNDADNALAHGCETLFRDDGDLAVKVQSALVSGLGLRDRGVKQRNDLAVLRFNGPAVLIELGFIKHPQDMEAVLDEETRKHTCKLIAEAFA